MRVKDIIFVFFKKNKFTIIFVSKVILIALLIVFVLETFFIDVLTVSSTQMEPVLKKNDKVYVNKLSYGFRMPTTLFSIPFCFDSIFGLKSYVSGAQLGYNRFSQTLPNEYDILLFNNPLEKHKPLDKRSLVISKCIGLPGNKIDISNESGQMAINDSIYMISPSLRQKYFIMLDEDDDILIFEYTIEQIMRSIGLGNREIDREKDGLSISMNIEEARLYNKNIPNKTYYATQGKASENEYSIVIPYRGFTIKVSEETLATYGQAILCDINSKEVNIMDGLLLENGRIVDKYTFLDDFVWALSDNASNHTDSRTIGFVPFSHIIGRVGCLW